MVIQSGTKLKNNTNTGKYHKSEFIKQLEVVKNEGILTIEHNGDFLDLELVREKFKLGLDAINICPELAQIQTNVLLRYINTNELLDYWYDLCIKSGIYKKWIDNNFNILDKERTILLVGHYFFNDQRIYPITQKYKEEIAADEMLWTKNYCAAIYGN